jgi:amino acid permease
VVFLTKLFANIFKEKTMRALFETALLLFALALAVASLILVPALLCDLLASALVWVAFALYFVFFLSTIGRVRKHGRFTPRQHDAQVKSVYGAIAYPIQFLGLGGAHWLAIYEYSRGESPLWVWSGLGLMLMLAAIVVNRLAAKELGRFWIGLLFKMSTAWSRVEFTAWCGIRFTPATSCCLWDT